MRRGSLKKSSNFKIQAEKNVFKGYLEKIDSCKTVQQYPHLKQVLLINILGYSGFKLSCL